LSYAAKADLSGFAPRQIRAVAGGQAHTVVLADDGTVWTCGSNQYGQLGVESIPESATLIQVAGLSSIVGIAAAGVHSVALGYDTRVWTWGSNVYGQLGDGTSFLENTGPMFRATPSPVKLLSGGWLTDATAIAAGDQHTVALLSKGTVMAWGLNSEGQIGDGSGQVVRSFPASVVSGAGSTSPLTGVNQVAAGLRFTLARVGDQVRAWGMNVYGELGNGNPGTNIATPVTVVSGPGSTAPLTGVLSIAAGGDHALAHVSDGGLLSWGLNNNGQLGDGTTQNSASPVTVRISNGSPLTEVAGCAAGWAHSLVVRKDDSLWAWGHGLHGQLGNGERGSAPDATTLRSKSAIEVQRGAGDALALPQTRGVGAGFYHSFTFNDSEVWTWGDNRSGQLANGKQTSHSPPERMVNLAKIADIDVGDDHSVVLDGTGHVWTVGSSRSGALGTGDNQLQTSVPVLVPQIDSVVEVGAGSSFSVVLRADGTVWSWGRNNQGQLGNGEEQKYHATPVQVMRNKENPLSGIKAISVGYNHTLALSENGEVWGWGDNGYGQLGETKGVYATLQVISSVDEISAGADHSVARVGETVYCWGDNGNRQLGMDESVEFSSVPLLLTESPQSSTALSGVRRIAAGRYHTLALMSDGTVRAWGDNSGGQLGIDEAMVSAAPVQVPGVSGAQAIAAGGSHSLALRPDGTVWAWGYNRQGQLGSGPLTIRFMPQRIPGLDRIRRIAAGEASSLALR